MNIPRRSFIATALAALGMGALVKRKAIAETRIPDVTVAASRNVFTSGEWVRTYAPSSKVAFEVVTTRTIPGPIA